jgi:hypothetical protein
MANPDAVWKCPTCRHQIDDIEVDVLDTEITAGKLHISDIVILKDGREFPVWGLDKTEAGVTVNLQNHEWTVPHDYKLMIADTRECPVCKGSGIYYGKGVVENGKFKGFTGTCFPCAGKGEQTRKDRIRTSTYWSKYAKIHA